MRIAELFENTATLDIQFDKTPDGNIVAVDMNTYDGAPDAGDAGRYGSGRNKQEAVEDLLDQLEDAGVYPPEVLQRAGQEYQIMAQGEMEDERDPGGNRRRSQQAAQDAQIMRQGDMEAERGMGIQDERPR